MPDSPGDRASLLVVEGLIVAMLVLGSLLYILHVGESGEAASNPRASLRAVAQDALTVLVDRPACLEFSNAEKRLECWHTYGAGMLGRYVTEALHGNTTNLTVKVGQLLPPGARFNLYMDNGKGAVPLRAVNAPGAETVSVAVTFAPSLHFAYVAPDFSCYDPSAPLNVTALPVFGASLAMADEATRGIAFANGYRPALSATARPYFLTGYFPASNLGPDGYPKASNAIVESAITYNTIKLRGGHVFNASATDCPLGAQVFVDARRGLNASGLEIAAPDGAGSSVPSRNFTLGERVLVHFDFGPYLSEVDDTGSFTARVRVFDPVPPSLGAVKYRESFRAAFAQASGTAEVRLGNTALYGPSLVCAEATTTLRGAGGVEKEITARKCDYFIVNLEDGAAAFAPTYRVVLEAWFPEWE